MKAATNIVLYDDQCPMCTFQMRALSWVDWFNVTTLLPMSDSRVEEVAPDLRQEDVSAAIHCVARNGRVCRGAGWLRYVGLVMDLFFRMALFVCVSAVRRCEDE